MTHIIFEILKYIIYKGILGLHTSCINFLQTGRMSLLNVAENIMTCLLCGVLRNISWTSRRISIRYMSKRMVKLWNLFGRPLFCFNLPNCSNILSHSSKIKCFKCVRLSFLLRIRANMRPGVPTTIWGVIFFNVSSSFWMERPPKNTPT